MKAEIRVRTNRPPPRAGAVHHGTNTLTFGTPSPTAVPTRRRMLSEHIANKKGKKASTEETLHPSFARPCKPRFAAAHLPPAAEPREADCASKSINMPPTHPNITSQRQHQLPLPHFARRSPRALQAWNVSVTTSSSSCSQDYTTRYQACPHHNVVNSP